MTASRVDQFLEDLCEVIGEYRTVGTLYVPYRVTESNGIKCQIVKKGSEGFEVELSAEEKQELDEKLLWNGFSSQEGHFSISRRSIISAQRELTRRMAPALTALKRLNDEALEMSKQLENLQASSMDVITRARRSLEVIASYPQMQTEIKRLIAEVDLFSRTITGFNEQLNGLL